MKAIPMKNNQEPIFLYIEDDFSSQKVIEVLLKRVMRFEHVTIFENSADFLPRLRALNPVPNIIFVDIQMKPHDGYAVLDMLRHELPFADSTIIAMTANVMSHDVEKLRAVGFNGLIGKPIIKEVFPQLVQRVVAGDAVWYIP